MADEEKNKKDEEKKPRRRRRKKAEEEGADQASAEKAEAPEESDDEASAEAGSEVGEGDGESEEKKPGRLRGSAQTTTKTETRPAPRRDGDGAVVVRARSRYVRSAPRKARLAMSHIRGKPVAQARAILSHTPRAVSSDIIKLLDSAVANAENNFELDADELRIERAFVDEGPTIKRYRPRALGRATRINKRTSHMTIELTTTEGVG